MFNVNKQVNKNCLCTNEGKGEVYIVNRQIIKRLSLEKIRIRFDRNYSNTTNSKCQKIRNVANLRFVIGIAVCVLESKLYQIRSNIWFQLLAFFKTN